MCTPGLPSHVLGLVSVTGQAMADGPARQVQSPSCFEQEVTEQTENTDSSLFPLFPPVQMLPSSGVGAESRLSVPGDHATVS